MQKLMLSILFCAFVALGISAQTTAFTYQGSLKEGVNPSNGNYDLEFKLFDLVTGGTQQGSTLQRLNVAVANGGFSVSLDFGSANLPGADRYLDIAVRTVGGGAFTPLTPRRQITSAPYTIQSLNSGTANVLSASCVNCVTATQIGSVNGSDVTGTIPVASMPAGSASYVQNSTGLQASSNFNISGTGTANIINAGSRYNINGSRILSNAGTDNLFAGVNAGNANSGDGNSFFGFSAGQSNTTGAENAYFGRNAGKTNTIGSANSFYGGTAGQQNTSGNGNSFFGNSAGQQNVGGNNNSFFGAFAGLSNTSSHNNSFFGASAGFVNGTGYENSFFGSSAGSSNGSGYRNSFFGTNAGDSNTAGFENAFFGHLAGSSNLGGDHNAFFGSGAGFTNTASDNSFFGNRAGYSTTTGPENTFFGAEAGEDNTFGESNSFFGFRSGWHNTIGARNAFFGESAGNNNSTGGDNTFLGVTAGLSNQTGHHNTLIGRDANTLLSDLSWATAVGADATVFTFNQVQLGRNNIDTVRIGTNGTGGGTALCLNPTFVLSTCSSSERYKKNIQPFASGLSLVRQLRPVTFDWKENDEHSLGVIAEEVAVVEPLLVTRNQKGEIEGVKYDQLSVVLINAVKEQQAQIEALQNTNAQQKAAVESQQKQNEELKTQVTELKTVVCSIKPDVEICKAKEKN